MACLLRSGFQTYSTIGLCLLPCHSVHSKARLSSHQFNWDKKVGSCHSYLPLSWDADYKRKCMWPKFWWLSLRARGHGKTGYGKHWPMCLILEQLQALFRQNSSQFPVSQFPFEVNFWMLPRSLQTVHLQTSFSCYREGWGHSAVDCISAWQNLRCWSWRNSGEPPVLLLIQLSAATVLLLLSS